MIIQSVKEDIFSAFMSKEFDVFIHGCNCQNTQNAGIAKTMRKYPEVYAADLKTEKGDPNKLGLYTIADTVDGKVINAYTQYNFGRNKRHVDYMAVGNVFRLINDDFRGLNLTFAIPSIGCNLGGGDWSIVKDIINDNTPDINIIHYYI